MYNIFITTHLLMMNHFIIEYHFFKAAQIKHISK